MKFINYFKKNNIINFISILFLSIILTVLFLYPVILNLSTHLTSQADGLFISWTIFTVSKFIVQAQNIFQMPIFYPFANTLAYSDPFLPTAILSIPILKFTQNIILLHNIHLLLGTIVMYISSFLLARQLKYSKTASYFSATVFTFSAIHLHYLVHLHTYLLAGLPLTFYFIFRWLEKDNWYWLFFALISFLYQAANAPMTGFFLIFALLALLLNKKFRVIVIKNIWLVLYYVFLGMLCLFFIYQPYFLVSQEFSYTRTIRDSAHFAHSIDRFLELDLIVFYFIFLVFKFTKQKKYKIKTTLTTLFILTIIFTGATLMLGPVVKIAGETFKIFGIPIPLPYLLMYYIVPGFRAFRASSRWIVLFNFGLSLLIGKVVSESKLNKYFSIIILVFFILFQYYFHINNFKVFEIDQNIPTIYSDIKKRPETTLVEFPVFLWRVMPYAYLENNRLLYQTVHEKILYNGVSGFTPPIREKQLNVFWQDFPDKNTISHLENENIELLMVDYSLYKTLYDNGFSYNQRNAQDPKNIKIELENLEKQKFIKFILCEDDRCLYKIVKRGVKLQI